MTTSEHTPGPWKVRFETMVYGPDGWAVANANMTGQPHPENAANARLIASAPDLVIALEDADAHLWHVFSCPAWTDPDIDEKPEGECECVLGRIADLLARVRGEEGLQ